MSGASASRTSGTTFGSYPGLAGRARAPRRRGARPLRAARRRPRPRDARARGARALRRILRPARPRLAARCDRARRSELQRDATSLGRRLYADEPEAFGRGSRSGGGHGATRRSIQRDAGRNLAPSIVNPADQTSRPSRRLPSSMPSRREPRLRRRPATRPREPVAVLQPRAVVARLQRPRAAARRGPLDAAARARQVRAIYQDNLDEFFMVRVANLHDQVEAGARRPRGRRAQRRRADRRDPRPRHRPALAATPLLGARPAPGARRARDPRHSPRRRRATRRSSSTPCSSSRSSPP